MSEYNDEFIEFPKDWDVRRLNEIAIIRSGFSERKRDENSKVIHLRPDNIDNETDRIVFHRIVYIPESPKIERYLLRHLDIVLVNTNGSINHIGKLGIIDMPLNQKITFSNHLTTIRIVSKDVEPYYIYYLLSWYHLNGSFKKVVKNQAGKWNLNLDTIRNLLIPIPPPEEQKKIVKILNTVDSIIIDTTNLIEKLKILKEKTLNLLITGKIWHKEFEDIEIGKIPKNWEIKRLGGIAEQMYYGLSVSGVDTPTQYKLITTTSINKETFKLDEENIPFCNLITNKDRKSKELTKYFVKKGDILISRSGTTGITILIDKDYNNMLFGSYLIKIRLNSIIDPKFFWYFAQSPFYWKQISSRGATIKNINLEILRNLRVPIPPLEEQKKIVEILSTIDNKIETETKYLDYMKKLKEKLLAALMTGKIRVNSIAIGDLR
jgi:type I restriction enzyme S subunit